MRKTLWIPGILEQAAPRSRVRLSSSHTLGSPLPLSKPFLQPILTDSHSFTDVFPALCLGRVAEEALLPKIIFTTLSLPSALSEEEPSSPHIPGALCTGETGLLKSKEPEEVVIPVDPFQLYIFYDLKYFSSYLGDRNG